MVKNVEDSCSLRKHEIPSTNLFLYSYFAVTLFPVDTGRKLNVHKTFKRRLGRLLNVLCTFYLRPVSTGSGTSTSSLLPEQTNSQHISTRSRSLRQTAQKMPFPADLVTFTGEILNGKLHFLCSGK